ALAAFEPAGYVERQAMVTHNLGEDYTELGLYRRARRTMQIAHEGYRRTGAQASGDNSTWALGGLELEMGHPDAARAYFDSVAAGDSPFFLGFEPLMRGRLAFRENDHASALRFYR